MKIFLTLTTLMLTLGFVFSDDDKKKDEKKDEGFDVKKLEGKWSLVSGMKNGTKSEGDALKTEFSVSGDVMKMKTGDGEFVFKLKIDPKKTPVQVDIEITEGPIGKGTVTKGILELKDDELKLCYDSTGMGDRPAKFEGEKAHLFVLKKKKDDK
jgi:uncharacterized protein (TIGR03067 family)